MQDSRQMVINTIIGIKKTITRIVAPFKRHGEVIVAIVFILSCIFYSAIKIGLKSYNITLQAQEQKLSQEVMQKQDDINELNGEITRLSDKGRMMKVLGTDVQERQSNIYIVH